MIEYENLNKSNRLFKEQLRNAFDEVFESGWFILGKKVNEFEKAFAAYCGSRHCIGVANGLDALTIALRTMNFEKGSEVIVPSNTYIATILSVLHNQLIPVLAEPDIDTYNISHLSIEEKISAKTRGVIAVHLYGKMCAMDSILAIAEKHNLTVIEDCAQAHGAKFKGQHAGTFGIFGAFSFYPTKNLGALGDAGAIITNDDLSAQTIRAIRNYGSVKKYYNEIPGFNSRLDELQAAFLLVKLKAMDKIINHKRMLAELYLSNLKNDFVLPKVHADFFDVYHIFNIRHPERNRLREFLRNNEIGAEIHYPVAPNKQKALAGILDNIFTPVAEEIHQTTLSLPISFYHSEQDIMRVIETLNKF